MFRSLWAVANTTTPTESTKYLTCDVAVKKTRFPPTAQHACASRARGSGILSERLDARTRKKQPRLVVDKTAMRDLRRLFLNSTARAPPKKHSPSLPGVGVEQIPSHRSNGVLPLVSGRHRAHRSL